MNNNEDRLSRLKLKEKIGYGFGDLGFNLYWTTISSFLAAFYTDVFGLQAGVAATMFFVTKLVDAFTDPIMGALADRTRTRFGKFRPYLLWAGLPMAGAAVLTFSTPDLEGTGKIVYAYATYTFMMLMYTVLSTPYSALSGVMTAQSQERTDLVSFRFIAAFTGMTLVNAFTLDLVDFFGAGDDAKGWQLTMMCYGLIASLIFVVSFASTKERISPPVTQKTNPLNDIKDLTQNKPWLVLFCLALIIMMTITLRGGSSFYYFKYYVEREDLISTYLLWQGLAYAVGAASTPILSRFIEKTKLLMILMTIVGTLSIAFFFVPKDAIWLMFTFNILISLALGPKSPLTWSMYADTADYTEWQTGRRATAMTFSAATFSQKLGSAIGSAGMLWLLSIMGYVANQAQNNASQTGIVITQTLAPGFFALLAVIFIRSYELNGDKLKRIQEELKLRSNKNDQ